MMRETDRIIKEVGRKQEETAQQMKETDRQMKESAKRLDKQLGKLGNRFGEIVEYMVAPNLKEKFREIGLSFQETSNNKAISDKDGTFLFEVDVLLENGDKALLVETKSKPSTEDVNDHVERLKKMRAWVDLKGDKRKFLAAIAGVVMTNDVRNYALKQGLFVIEPSGKTFTILRPTWPPHGQPREW
ncbi:hypothetical protein FACS1894130_08330 [Spirochaetia bacterium]|nr:hypothetical protein FACS1894130_08330 [Spirochaetia bacterium]